MANPAENPIFSLQKYKLTSVIGALKGAS